jgi:hypothetical protein
MPADLIRNIRKNLKDRFTILASHPIEQRRTKSKRFLAIINGIQIQDSFRSNEKSAKVPSIKTAIICKLAQTTLEIRMTLLIEVKKWLLNERKRQQQEDDKMKKSLSLRKTVAVPNDKETNNASMSN